jgi:hypothetical protein
MYFIREETSLDFWFFRKPDEHWTEASAFRTKEEAMEAWAESPEEVRQKHPRAYIVGPYGGYYTMTGKRIRNERKYAFPS